LDLLKLLLQLFSNFLVYSYMSDINISLIDEDLFAIFKNFINVTDNL